LIPSPFKNYKMKKLLMMIAPAILLLMAFRSGDSFSVSGRITTKDGTPVSAASSRRL
jgi:hypothetical protein